MANKDNSRTVDQVWEVVTRPFQWSEVEVKPQAFTQDKSRAIAVVYFDARAVMARLDEAFGPEGWTASYEPITLGNKYGMLCTLTVKVGDTIITRQDAAEVSDIESIKGAVSGSLKRAFSALGNRGLYEVDLGWHQWDQAKRRFAQPAFAAMRKIYEHALDLEGQGVTTQENVEEEALAAFRGYGFDPVQVESMKVRVDAAGLSLKRVVLDAWNEGVRTADQFGEYLSGRVG